MAKKASQPRKNTLRLSKEREADLASEASKLKAAAERLQKNAVKTYEAAHNVDERSDHVHKRAHALHMKVHSVAKSGQFNRQSQLFPIVGVGASAGGLEAMTQFLRHVPKDTGMAFVLVQHLDPTHESAMVPLLSRSSALRVVEARHNMLVERRHVYILPPNRMISIQDRRLKVLPRKDGDDIHYPIDVFFHSLAQAESGSAIGVVLSGNGSDGTSGLQAIKAEGGITFAQDEKSAKYASMPSRAASSGFVDFVLTPDKIAYELARIAGHPYVKPEETPKRQPPATEEKAFDDILSTLRHRMGVDFTHYKRATVERRIHRRMVLHKFEKLKDYANYVQAQAAEAKELFNDVLIHVTSFFRDPIMFSALRKKIFPKLFKVKNQSEPIRIWVPGCSTGEEVYSIAMTLMEVMAEKQVHLPVQIFGTDINDLALEKARAGIYPENIQQNVSQERLRRFFIRHEGGFRINKTIRELCIFARQNVVMDPPFSNLDIISCRNVLIYLGQPLQRKIMPVFHYALKPTGVLLLGVSETVGGFGELFELTDKKAKVYSKKIGQVRPTITFGQFQPQPTISGGATQKVAQAETSLGDIQKQVDRILLSNFSPSGVVINNQMEIVQFRGRTGDFFEHAHGEASLNLLKMAREGLSMDLRTAVGKAIKQNTRVRHEGARVKQNGHFLDVAIEVVPFQVSPSKEKYYMILLESSRQPQQDDIRKGRDKKSRSNASDVEINHLREELASTRESLQAIIEEQEATNEELRSANEEIMSSNEELQSTNEELETAKEELQSTNEELTTLNEELETRNTEMTHVNNDLHNVMASINIPMLILGRDLRIRRFTPAAEKLFNFIMSDVGRPLTDIAMKVELPNLDKIVMEVIDSLVMKELEVRDKDGHYWSVRIRPYKTTDNKIDGAILALLDIDAVKSGMKKGKE